MKTACFLLLFHTGMSPVNGIYKTHFIPSISSFLTSDSLISAFCFLNQTIYYFLLGVMVISNSPQIAINQQPLFPPVADQFSHSKHQPHQQTGSSNTCCILNTPANQSPTAPRLISNNIASRSFSGIPPAVRSTTWIIRQNSRKSTQN